MTRTHGLALVLVALAAAGASFVVTNAWQANRSPTSAPVVTPSGHHGLANWLQLGPTSAPAVTALEEAYRAERATLEANVAAEREALAALFEDPLATDAAIRAQVERVIAASNALERRTAEFLLSVRPHLDHSQQQQLLSYFAQGVRESGHNRWRYGQQRGADDSGRRGGPPAGRGSGSGSGNNRRGGGPPWSNTTRR